VIEIARQIAVICRGDIIVIWRSHVRVVQGCLALCFSIAAPGRLPHWALGAWGMEVQKAAIQNSTHRRRMRSRCNQTGNLLQDCLRTRMLLQGIEPRTLFAPSSQHPILPTGEAVE
jgi:hypothetical protein